MPLREREVETDDARVLAALRGGDEEAFGALVRRHTPALLRVARSYVSTQAVAEEVVQETWLGVLRGLDRFEARSSLRTWIFRILVNRALTRGASEARALPFASLVAAELDDGAPAVPAERFLPDDHRSWPRHWAAPPSRWENLPEEALALNETRRLVATAIASLPAAQRLVITMRDVEGWPAEEVCSMLKLTPGNQRVLLHRARARCREMLAEDFAT
ncbi:RNA polymerase sigma factor [Paraconexibacter algicola]|uniref:RNA polymerase subunit sigma-24 n=1 Tax=Paraconexibacter algicola TaxID=2133960 RepID=A0A2T4UHA4_9ACTN|nr:sigma-70 family RNA polymerase sigma factor [Paraconexibacter algicola]PTL58597.1 RNA polymerase subunit sigma-24 [Paraconexibacter algicola]